MAQQVTLTYYGFEGTGRTMKDAKLDAGRKIEALHDGYWTPVVLTARTGAQILCYRTLNGWGYCFIRDGELSGGMSCCRGGREECERSARKHLGSNETPWQTCFTVDHVDPIVRDDRDRKAIVSECKWQRDYAAARAAGLDDANARHFIGGYTQFMTQPIPPELQPTLAVA